MMECKHKYYQRIEGKLVCAQCGAPSPRPDVFAPLIEDKAEDMPENKGGLSWPPEARRQRGRPPNKK